MGFTRALYYPTIDIADWDWAKSAALFWDNIQTIVPATIENPYQGRVTEVLHKEGLLTPYTVSPDFHIVEDLTAEVTKHLETNEGFEFLVKGEHQNSFIHTDKLPRQIARISRLHPEKLSSEIRHLIRDDIERDGWLEVDSRFAKFYMTLLANKICERERFALLTDHTLSSKLSEKAKLDNQRNVIRRERPWEYERYENTTLHLSQGLLSNLILKGIRFAPDTRTEDIIKFKGKHLDELGAFRNALERLVSDIPSDASFEAVQQHVHDIYINDFQPAYNNFQKALTGFRLKWISDNLMKITFFSSGTTSLLPFLIGATIPQALLAGAGISVVTSVISYNQDKAKMLRDSPYSYLVSADNNLGKEDFQRSLRNTIF